MREGRSRGAVGESFMSAKSKLNCRSDNGREGKRKAKHFTICLLLQLALSLQIQILYVQSTGKSCLPFLIHASQVCIPE